ncbi:MAG: hypothetical protein WC692_09105 [Erythrobacter sp.]|jgi:hypothetical protein
MRILLGLVLLAIAAPATAREAVEASAPQELSVTVYRNPDRGENEAMDRALPQGFAMISEVRTVTLPPGGATIRFTGVAEGMVAVSAIVTGLPGGTIEKNRNADLLSPAALVDGTLGNRVRITRTNPATGAAQSESAIVRTRADGGLVLQTAAGYEAVRCSGLPESLGFDRVPAGLSPQPVFTIDTRSAQGGTYTVTLTYLAWGFDWEASYVARLGEGRRDGTLRMDLMSWLTILNDNNQSFADAELLAVAGTLNIESDFEELADPPEGRSLRLTCFPFGSTAAGSPYASPPPPPPPSPAYADAEAIVVTGKRLSIALQESPKALSVVAAEEALGDLKLYRIPVRVSVAAQGQKQVAFLDRKAVEARFVYRHECFDDGPGAFQPAQVLLTTVNAKKNGLGQALPMGAITLYEPSDHGDLLVGETRMRDYALDQDVELELDQSAQVQAACGIVSKVDGERPGIWHDLRASVANANDTAITMRFDLGSAGDYEVRGAKGMRVKDGKRIVEVTVPANARRSFAFRRRGVTGD